MESFKQYSVDKASKLSDTAGKFLAAPLKSRFVRSALKETIKGGILIGRMTLNAIEGPRKEFSKLFEEARQETKPTGPSKGKRIPIKKKGETEKKLEEQSIEELYELAQKYDVAGRSEMKKKELIKAIREKQSES